MSEVQAEPFSTWAQRRIAQAVEAGDLRGDVALQFQERLAAAPAQRPSREAVVESLAAALGLPLSEASRTLARLERQPQARQTVALREMLQEWLESRLRDRRERR